MKILSCNSNLPLADSISKELNLKLVDAEVKRFSDMEVFVEVSKSHWLVVIVSTDVDV